jgi:hypothetical protein
VRKVIALTAAAGLLVTLAGCTVSAPSGPCEPIPAGDASKLVTVDGKFGEQPKVEFPTPLTTDDLEVSVVEKGDGATIHDGDFIFLTYTGYDATTGEQASPTSSGRLIADQDTDAYRLFECLTVGSRVAAVLPATEQTETAAATVTSLLVIDIDRAVHSRATGRIELPAEGMPSVVTAPEGDPGITIMNEDPPKALKYSTLITGDGKKVKEGDQVLLQYTIVNWDTKAIVESTWDKAGFPTTRAFTAFDPESGEGMNSAALTALKGKTVGSQVLVVMPPSTWAGGDIQATEGSTLVVVYDILAIE